MRDLYLLSFGDVLLASFASTFSMLAQELIAANYESRGTNARVPSVRQCHLPSGACLPERPLVSIRPKDHWYTSLLHWPTAEVRNPSWSCGSPSPPPSSGPPPARGGKGYASHSNNANDKPQQQKEQAQPQAPKAATTTTTPTTTTTANISAPRAAPAARQHQQQKHKQNSYLQTVLELATPKVAFLLLISA